MVRGGKGIAGFTLIEIMIVIIIVTLAAGMIAPLGFRELEKSRAKTEYLKLRNVIKLHTTKAFSQGIRYQMKMLDHTLTASSVLGDVDYHYDYLNLPNLTFNINANGYPSVDHFDLDASGLARRITLQDMLGVKQDSIYAKQ